MTNFSKDKLDDFLTKLRSDSDSVIASFWSFAVQETQPDVVPDDIFKYASVFVWFTSLERGYVLDELEKEIVRINKDTKMSYWNDARELGDL